MNNKIALILASFLGLFLELSLIRWFPAHIFSIAFFSNTVLIASFLGLGLGFLFSNHKRDFFNSFMYILVGAVGLVLLLSNIKVKVPSDAQTWIWSYYGYYESGLSNVFFLKVSITQIIGVIFTLTVLIFIPVGQKIGKLMKEFEPLYAYTLNIIGSLLGVISFAIISFFSAPAYIWLLFSGIIVLLVTYKRKLFLIHAIIMALMVFAIAFTEKQTLWSPYYAINFKVDDDKSVLIYVNQLFHQKALNFEKEPDLYKKYSFPYELFRPERILIVGAGTGNDVWAAQKSGARCIDAVEIDPLIVMLGRTLNPLSPYSNNNVHVYIDDARSFMHKASEKYDMIVFGTLDSHATLSIASSIRLDNYVYTQESLREARELLAPEGVVVLLFCVPTEWMARRLIDTARAVFGEEDIRYVISDNYNNYLFNMMILAGPGVKKVLSEHPPLSQTLLVLPPKANMPLPQDDWPYLYLKERGIPYLYLLTLVVLIFISFGLLFIFTPLRKGKIELLFLFLGVGFLLLETKSVTTFSLLFGSTWLVNAVVFSAILAIALLANWIVMKKRLNYPLIFFGGLCLSLLLLYFFPLDSLLKFSFSAKIFFAGALVALPIFFSSFIFAILIQSTKDVGISLGSNLLGAVLGGFIEYLSMIYGLNTLYLIALGCYMVAAMCLLIKKHQT